METNDAMREILPDVRLCLDRCPLSRPAGGWGVHLQWPPRAIPEAEGGGWLLGFEMGPRPGRAMECLAGEVRESGPAGEGLMAALGTSFSAAVVDRGLAADLLAASERPARFLRDGGRSCPLCLEHAISFMARAGEGAGQ